VSPGQGYTLTYDVTTCGGTYTRVSAAWIDWNQNFVFDAGEMLAAPSTTTLALQTISTTFTVPSDAVNGQTRLRVMVQERSTATLGPCDPFGYGGVKDFTIQVGKGGGGSAGGSSGALAVLLIMIFCPLGYLAAGTAWGYKQGKSGREAVPHWEHIVNSPRYFVTGITTSIQWVKTKLGRGGTSGEFAEI